MPRELRALLTGAADRRLSRALREGCQGKRVGGKGMAGTGRRKEPGWEGQDGNRGSMTAPMSFLCLSVPKTS